MKINYVSEEERIKHNLMRMESQETPKFKNCVLLYPFCIVSIRLFCVQSFKPFFIFFFLVLLEKEKAQIQAPPIKIPYS